MVEIEMKRKEKKPKSLGPQTVDTTILLPFKKLIILFSFVVVFWCQIPKIPTR